MFMSSFALYIVWIASLQAIAPKHQSNYHASHDVRCNSTNHFALNTQTSRTQRHAQLQASASQTSPIPSHEFEGLSTAAVHPICKYESEALNALYNVDKVYVSVVFQSQDAMYARSTKRSVYKRRNTETRKHRTKPVHFALATQTPNHTHLQAAHIPTYDIQSSSLLQSLSAYCTQGDSKGRNRDGSGAVNALYNVHKVSGHNDDRDALNMISHKWVFPTTSSALVDPHTPNPIVPKQIQSFILVSTLLSCTSSRPFIPSPIASRDRKFTILLNTATTIQPRRLTSSYPDDVNHWNVSDRDALPAAFNLYTKIFGQITNHKASNPVPSNTDYKQNLYFVCVAVFLLITLIMFSHKQVVNGFILVTMCVTLGSCSALNITLSNWAQSNAVLSADSTGAFFGSNSTTQQLFIFGGSNIPGQLFTYDITQEQFTESALSISLPYGCSSCYTQYNDDIYFVSNYTLGKMNLNTHAIFESSTQIPVYGKRTCLEVSVDGRFIFIIGGSTNSGSDNNSKRKEVSIYDIQQNTLSSAPDMGQIRSYLACIIVNDYLYAMGGDSGAAPHDTIERIYVGDIASIASETWVSLSARMSNTRNVILSVSIGKHIYIMGGASEGTPFDDVDRLDTDTLLLYQDTSLPIPMNRLIGSAINDHTIYVIYQTNVYWASAPTQSPTNAPSQAPTFAPSLAPSIAPSVSPTQSPSSSPSLAPTESPTRTHNPTGTPTTQPTQSPSSSPTLAPTGQPTRNPSFAPSMPPTQSPSSSPTSTPTDHPSNNPSGAPSVQPTKSPSSYPTTYDTTTLLYDDYHSDQDPPDDLVTVLVTVLATVLVIVCIVFITYKYRTKKQNQKEPSRPMKQTSNIDDTKVEMAAPNDTSIIKRHEAVNIEVKRTRVDNVLVMFFGMGKYLSDTYPDLDDIAEDEEWFRTVFEKKFKYRFIANDNYNQTWERSEAMKWIQCVRENELLRNRPVKYNGLIFCGASHGSMHAMICSDGKPLKLQDIRSSFASTVNSQFKDIPKIFIFNCCRTVPGQKPRGREEQTGAAGYSVTITGTEGDEVFGSGLSQCVADAFDKCCTNKWDVHKTLLEATHIAEKENIKLVTQEHDLTIDAVVFRKSPQARGPVVDPQLVVPDDDLTNVLRPQKGGSKMDLLYKGYYDALFNAGFQDNDNLRKLTMEKLNDVGIEMRFHQKELLKRVSKL
eukprot:78874_1